MKKKILFLTRSTSEEALLGHYSTSSQDYEVNLISSFAKHIDITVIYIGVIAASAKTDKIGKNVLLRNGQSITYLSLGKISFSGMFSAVALVKRFIGNREAAILTTGYHPNEMLALLLAKSATVRIYSIVYDTHAQGNARMRHIKRWAANAYFMLGYELLNYLSGVIVVNDLFVKDEMKKFRFLKSRIGGVCVERSVVRKPRSTPLKILFAGTLNTENGVELISELLRMNPGLNVELAIAGYGEREGMIAAMAERDHRIKFCGTLTNEALDAVIAKSDLLVCLRDPKSSVCRYAFPSKLIKFMSSGVPVISNEFPGLGKEYYPHLLLIREFSSAALRDLIEDLKFIDFLHIGTSAKSHIEANHRWSDISLEMIGFMFPRADQTVLIAPGRDRK